MQYAILNFLLICCFNGQIFSQVSFTTVQGQKANYTLSIPSSYLYDKAIGVNVDLKYNNEEGASIVTVVKKLPSNIKESDIDQMSIPSDQDFIDQLESNGLQNIRVIKRGFIHINGVRSYFAYYRNTYVYFHSITQIRKGKIINLTYTCEYLKKDAYMPYIFRVVNSLKS
ncbi:MAG: hypothetical protein RL115_1373 [Bacteroidota bacterium]